MLQATDFLITGSVDGHLKFWKKKPEGVEFVKHFRAHKGAIDGALTHVVILSLVQSSTDWPLLPVRRGSGGRRKILHDERT